MSWVLLLVLMSSSQGSMTTLEFSDYKSCMNAGEKMKELVSEKTPVFSHHIKYSCISVSGLR